MNSFFKKIIFLDNSSEFFCWTKANRAIASWIRGKYGALANVENQSIKNIKQKVKNAMMHFLDKTRINKQLHYEN